MPIPIIVSGEVAQGNSCDLEFQLEYDPVTPIALSNIQTAIMRLVHHDSRETFINNRTDVDVKGSFSATGYFSHPLTAEDNQMHPVGERRKKEIHVAVITIVATGDNGDEIFEREFWITVVNQQHVQNALHVNPISMVFSTVDPTVVIA